MLCRRWLSHHVSRQSNIWVSPWRSFYDKPPQGRSSHSRLSHDTQVGLEVVLHGMFQ